LGGKWYCRYPELRECHDPAMFPVDEVQIEGLHMNDIRLGKSIYIKKQLDKFATFQDNQRNRRAYLAKTAELAYKGRNDKGEWGLALGAQAQSSMVNITGMSFITLYTVIGPLIFFVSLLLMVVGGLKLVVTIFLRVTIILRYRGCGCGFWLLSGKHYSS
jgi:hypothetical protein